MKGIIVKPLRKIPDERGSVCHMLRADDPDFKQFGEIYFSTVYPGVIKGWHKHTKMELNYCCIKGMIKLVVFDGRNFEEYYLGDKNYCLVKVRPEIWNAFQGLGTEEAIVANCASIPHDPNEIIRKGVKEIVYDWKNFTYGW